MGLTALAYAAAFVDPLLDALGPTCWMRSARDDTAKPLDAASARRLLLDPGETAALVSADTLHPEADVAAVAGAERRYAAPALRRLLETPSCVVLFPEPAHHGHDWSFFAARPLREALVEAFRRHRQSGTRRFVVPFRKARSEHKFYFETWQLDQPLPDYIEEV